VTVLPACPAAATTEVGDVDGGPPGVAAGMVRQRPPPKLNTSLMGPLGGAGARDLGAQCLRSPPLGQGGEWLQKPRDKCSKSS
jgi:hypothetical protein